MIKEFAQELYETGRSYVGVARHPTRLVTGSWKAAKDVFYETPRALIRQDWGLDLENQTERDLSIDRKSSAALVLSEAVAFGGSVAGTALFSSMGASRYEAGVLGSIIGNYVLGASSFVALYALSTRREHSIEGHNSFLEGVRYSARVLPAALGAYLFDGNMVAGFIAAGVPPMPAVVAVNAVSVVAYTSTAKAVNDRVVRPE